jgi:hypothetical protein
MMRLLRGIAAFALVSAAVILVVPRLLFHLGLVGPTTAQRVGAARQAVEVARGYGARAAEIPAMAAAEREIASAEALAARGEEHAARDAAARALSLAGAAQRAAIVGHDAQRIRAKQIIDTLDQRIDKLEDLYSSHSKGVGPERARLLFSRMKQARASAAVLVLAWEQEDYSAVIAGEGKALAAIEDVRRELQGGPS